jgi:RNA polymerase sigma factor (sigma-70 family)
MRNAPSQVISLEEYVETHQIAATTPSTEEAAVTELQKAELRRCVAALPELQREVVVRVYGLDLAAGAMRPTQDAVAASLGVSASRIARVLTAARRTLLSQLEMAA